MKKMTLAKKIIVAVLIAALAAGMTALVLLTVNKSSGNQWTGTWVAESVNAGGPTYVLADAGLSGEDMVTMVLKADGTATLKLSGQDYRADWSEEEGVITVTAGNSKLTFDGNKYEGRLCVDLTDYEVILGKKE